MKKLALLLAMLMSLTFTLTACGGNDGKTTSDDPNTADSDLFFDPDKFEVKAIDEKTLEVNLTAKTPYFLELTAFPVFSPVKTDIIAEEGEAWSTDPETYIGNGTYQMTEWVTDSHITMKKNENHWDADNLGPDEIVFNLIEDDTAQYNSYQADELAFIDTVPTDLIASLKDKDDFHVITQLGTYYISYNVNEAPFDDPLVREALTLAIDREYMAEQVGDGLYLPAGAFVPAGLSDVDPKDEFRTVGEDYYDPTDYEGNLEKAKKLMEEAGYPDGAGLSPVTYIYNDTTLHKAVGEALQDMWGKLGLSVQIEVQEWNTFLQSRKSGDFQVARDGWLADYNDPITFLDMYITGGGNNNAQWSNKDYDALITTAKSEDDPKVRMQAMHDAEDLLFDEWVVCPIMYYADMYMQNKDMDKTSWASPLGFKYFMYTEGYDKLEVCIGPNPDSIDPALNTAVDGGTMIIHAFEGLYRLDKEGVPEPAMAEKVDISDDGLTYTFTLRDDAKWSDGTPVTAQDFVDSWTRAIDPETAADYSYMFEVIAGYNEAIGEDAEE